MERGHITVSLCEYETRISLRQVQASTLHSDRFELLLRCEVIGILIGSGVRSLLGMALTSGLVVTVLTDNINDSQQHSPTLQKHKSVHLGLGHRDGRKAQSLVGLPSLCPTC